VCKNISTVIRFCREDVAPVFELYVEDTAPVKGIRKKLQMFKDSVRRIFPWNPCPLEQHPVAHDSGGANAEEGGVTGVW
jgi:hypothetical protein